MTLYHLFLVAAIQGITEFLPVSSSGHLILLPNLTNLDDQGQVIDVAVHVGTLMAVILFFRKDMRLAFSGIPDLLGGRMDTPGARLAFLLLIATIPVVFVGLILQITGIAASMRSITVVGWAMLLFGILLWWMDQKGPAQKTEAEWTLRDAIILGLWQAVALIPGASRSGTTITGARHLGYNRHDAAKLAMLMSVPTILASGTLLVIQTAPYATEELLRDGLISAVFSCIAALLALSLMMRLLRSVSFTPYVIYRIAIGVALLWIAYT